MIKVYTISDDYVNTRLDKWFKIVVNKLPQSFIEKKFKKRKNKSKL